MNSASRNLIVLIACVCLLPGTRAVSADEEPKESSADPFQLPEGNAPDVLQFIKDVKRLRPKERTRESITQHIKQQVQAIEKAAGVIGDMVDASDRDQLIAMEEQFVAYSLLARIEPGVAHEKVQELNRLVQQDPRPEFADVADFHLLQSNVAQTERVGSDQLEVAIEVGAYIDKHGLDRVVLGYAESLGARMVRNGQSAAAAQLFGRLAEAVRDSGDSKLMENLPHLTNTARRLNLPGKFMDLEGTTADGTPFDWESYRGKFVLIDFWATWCAPCRAEVPNMKHHLDLYGEKGFTIVGVNIDEDRSEFDAYMADTELPWQQIMPTEDGRNPMAEYYAVSSYPTLIMVDPEGKVISMDASGRNLGELLTRYLGPVEDQIVPEEPN